MGEGEPVVLIHGFLENHKMWIPFAEELSQNYLVIMPDLLGHGQTSSIAQTHTMEMQADLIRGILDELGLDKATLVGHSMGGYASLYFAQAFPERVQGLSLFYSKSQPDDAEKKEQRLKAVQTVEKDRESFIRLTIPKLFNPNELDHLQSQINLAKEWAMETPLEGITAALRGMREREDTMSVIQKATYPFQVILGEFDSAVDAASYAPTLPEKENLSISILPTGHMGHLEDPDVCLDLIANFLQNVYR